MYGYKAGAIEIGLKRFSSQDVGIMCRFGHVALMDLVCRKNVCRPTPVNLAQAAIDGHVHVMEYGKEWDQRPSFSASLIAAEHGQLEILKWMESNRVSMYRKTGLVAMKHGHLNIVQWWWEKFGFSLGDVYRFLEDAVKDRDENRLKLLLGWQEISCEDLMRYEGLPWFRQLLVEYGYIEP